MVGTVNIDASLLFPKKYGDYLQVPFLFYAPFFFLHKENILPENSVFPYCELDVC